MKSIKVAIIAIIAIMTLSSCGSSLVYAKPQQVTTQLTCSGFPDNHFNNLNYGLDITVTSDVANEEILDMSELDAKTKKMLKGITFTFEPLIKDFVKESITRYARSSGITVGSDYNNDYRLNVRVREFKAIDSSTGNARCTVVLDYTLTNPDNEIILQQTARGRHIMSTGQNLGNCLDKAYSEALADMD